MGLKLEQFTPDVIERHRFTTDIRRPVSGGTLCIGRNIDTGEPRIVMRHSYNVGDSEPEPTFYRIVQG